MIIWILIANHGEETIDVFTFQSEHEALNKFIQEVRSKEIKEDASEYLKIMKGQGRVRLGNILYEIRVTNLSLVIRV